MKIRWAGHSQFVIQTMGKTIVTDPPAPSYGYPAITEIPDIVTVSHEHGDHNSVKTLSGNPYVIKGSGSQTIQGIVFTGHPCWHDPEQGKLRGENTIFQIQAEGINLVHMGDIGEILSDEQIQALGKVDILMIPIGSVFTINADEAFTLIQNIKPKIVIPMHYMTSFLSFELDPPERFTQKFDQVIYRPFLEITADQIPSDMQVFMLTL